MKQLQGSRWLVIGGAGYIGAHVVHELQSQGACTTVIDDLSTGFRERLPGDSRVIISDARDPANLFASISGSVDGVIHLAALKQARESVRRPTDYWKTNLELVLSLVEFVRGGGAKNVLYSSSCSIFGSADFVDDQTRPGPISPYGWSKLVGEKVLADSSVELNFSFLSLRYFNVIGNGSFPLAHDHATESLVPSIFRCMSDGRRPQVFGSDFLTPDGTCVRDYLDVRDLAAAHVRGAIALLSGKPLETMYLNLSSGKPTSVLEIMDLAKSITQSPMEPEFLARKQGDPAAIWGSNETARSRLGWKPTFSLRSSLESHWTSTQDYRGFV